jgi:hypothetical protein
MDLQRIITQNPVCLLLDGEREKTWRILNVHYQSLNYLRNWLERNLVSMAFNWIEAFENTSLYPDEILASRIGLVPISADPLVMKEFTGEEPDACSEFTCLVFDLNVTNRSNTVQNVLTRDLQWVPLGTQAARFREPPRVTYPDLILAKLPPGRTIHLRAYAIRGTGEEHAKWSSTNVFYRAIPTRRPAQGEVRISGQSLRLGSSTCPRCEDLPLEVTLEPGFNCYYFTIRLTGGLTFEQIDEQLRERFTWDGNYPVLSVQYRFEQ